uniref:Transposon protein, putative, unclassified n=1 Tax=Oryza sativa subsp. japonica TaxID=39947 RepID=Q2R4Q1_ORYSJ|nr:transposon protein, putative, unclassified [Oryza sativa Japonica Group]
MATTKKAAGAEEGGGVARVDGDDGAPAVDELGEVVGGVGGDAAKPEKATPRRETVPASGEGRPEVVGDGGERGRQRELVSGEEKMRQVAETGEGGSFWDVTFSPFTTGTTSPPPHPSHLNYTASSRTLAA